MKEELKNKDCKIHALNQNPPLNFDDDEAPMSDLNYHVLTGLTREQFNDLCSEIPPSALRDTDIRTPRTTIACLLVKLRLGLSHQALCTLFSFEDKPYARYNPKHLQQRASDYYNSITDAQDYSDLSDSNSENSDDDSNILYSLG
ncbi:unnamed protein product [Rotaria sordida]|uniref:Uncharacterized protein n=2 Tax=Rotaria sordida TaxID=392033 RepID=A0A819GPR3_9BILA|nr:unnamed protein product [Rotaria sordida]CAF3889865.1 unnamed protein product [Rotaria sordida]